ncbi:MAG: hypothetical protein IH850_00050 [Acidobacteria bacterium]|nr:hypothetical protein [Acidobacteriota bacterium]
MMRRVGIVVAWLAATMVAILIASTAVGSVRGQVTDVPAIPTAGTAALLATTTTTIGEQATTSTPPTTDGSAAPTTTITVPPTASSTTTTTAPASTPTTTSPPAPTTTTTTTTTTTVPPRPAVTTYSLIGGQVWISADEPDVVFVNAVPKAGFSVEIDKAGPEEVRVEFESSDHESSFRARWKDGELDIDIEEES